MTDEMKDDAQWFDAIGGCSSCGKPAHGIVMGRRNQRMGAYCRPCGDKRIKKAKAARELPPPPGQGEG